MPIGDNALAVRTQLSYDIETQCVIDGSEMPEIKYFVPAYDPSIILTEEGQFAGVTLPDKTVTEITNRIDPDFLGDIQSYHVIRVASDGEEPARIRVKIFKKADEYNIGGEANVFYMLDENQDIICIIHTYPHSFVSGKWEIITELVYNNDGPIASVTADPSNFDMAIASEILLPEVIYGGTVEKNAGKAGYLISQIDTVDHADKRVTFLKGCDPFTEDVAITESDIDFNMESPIAELDLAGYELTISGEKICGSIKLVNAGTGKVVITGSKVYLNIISDNDDCLDHTQLSGIVVVNGRMYKGNAPVKEDEIARKADITFLIDSAPAVLDTLNELAAALGDDPNFATTITNSIATKAPIDNPSFTGTVRITSSGGDTRPLDIRASDGGYGASFYETSAGDFYLEMDNAAQLKKIHLDTNGASWFNAGFIGIGQTSPLDTLHLYKSGGTAGLRFQWDATHSGIIDFREGPTPTGLIEMHSPTDSVEAGNMVIETTSAGGGGKGILLRTNSTNAMFIDSSQKVGFGIGSPLAHIHAEATGACEIRTSTTGGAIIGKLISGEGGDVRVGSVTGHSLSLIVSNSPRLTLDSTGGVSKAGGQFNVHNISDYHSEGYRFSDNTSGVLHNLGSHTDGAGIWSVYNGTWTDAINVSPVATIQFGAYGAGIAQLDSSGNMSSSVALANGTTATTQAANDNSTKVATTAYADTVSKNQMPINTIIMYDGSDWVDNSKMPGWYACIAGNTGLGCPDMTNKFAMGRVVAGSGSTGGTNSLTLTEANLPSHTHTMNHTHGSFSGTVGSQSASHIHSMKFTTSSGGGHYALESASAVSTTTATAGTQSASHTHTVSVNVTEYTGSTGSIGSGTAIDNKPAYYSMIYIKRIS
jgi:microcystin-dependent protein